jgi:hypothetical protein
MAYKWASPKTNPAAHYLPQIFTRDEEKLLYRCLGTAAVSTERRGVAAGPLQIRGKTTEYVSAEQEAVLKALERAEGNKEDVIVAVREAINRSKDRRPQSAKKWLRPKGRSNFSPTKFDEWWGKVTTQSLKKRAAAVSKLRQKAMSRESYATPVLSGTIGYFGRDSQNPWGRACMWNRDHTYAFERVLPLIRRIDEAFRLAMPTRYEAQKRFCEKLDPRFVIPGTCFTTITVNKNFRTYPHRDSGDLSQGMSNIAVFSNGREFTGGHLILPEFNVEFTLAPRDLLFIANHEYIHENTAIAASDPESERMSIVCYAREDLAFCGALEYEELRRRFKVKRKIFPRMWVSREWFDFLQSATDEQGRPPPATYLVDQARRKGMLSVEILMLSALHERDALGSTGNWEYLAQLPKPNYKQTEALSALTSAMHFGTPRQDKWDDEDGPVNVDALYINSERWAIAYCESESGAVKLPNNRFNVQAVGFLAFIPLEISRLSRDAVEWLLRCWDSGRDVWLIRVPTQIPEAPFRYAFTTLSINLNWRKREQALEGSWQQYYNAAGSVALRNSWRIAPQSELMYELGFAHGGSLRGTLVKSPANVLCHAIEVRDELERLFLEQELAHWKGRAQNIASNDFRSRYERIGTYAMPSRPLDRALAGSPWRIAAEPTRLNLTKARQWQPTLHLECPSQGAATKLTWSSSFQAVPLLAARTGPDASLLLWRYKDRPGGGQAVATNGESYWLFQSIASVVPIRRGSRPPVTQKISEPTIVGHLQRAPTYWRHDKSKLREKLQQRAEFVPSPFSEMSEDRLAEYRSSYRQGRANVLAIGGPPASGKTFILKRLISRAHDWVVLKKEKLLDCMYSEKLKLYVLGKYRANGGIFQGTDKLSMAVQPAAESFLASVANTPVNIVFEGDRLFTESFLSRVVALETNLAILRFVVSRSIKTARHIARGDSQNEKFKRGRETKVQNVCRLPVVWDCVEEVRNESEEDSKRILKMMEWFLSRSI